MAAVINILQVFVVQFAILCAAAVCYSTRFGYAEIAGLDTVGLDIDGQMCGELTELKLQNFIP